MTATQARRIDEVAVVFNGKTPSKSEQRDGGHPVLKVKDVDALGRFRGIFSGYVDADLARKHVKQQLAGGETLVLNAAHNATHVASKTFYADQDVAGSLATGEWLIVRWSTEAVDSRYGNHWINVPDTRFRIRRLVNGIHLYPKDVARLQIPVPPLAEQKRIAGILDAADAVRAKRREALAQFDTLLQSTFLDMFGDPVTNPKGWGVVAFESIGNSRLGKMLDKGKEVGDCQFPYLANTNVQWGRFDLAALRTMDFSESDCEEFKLEDGDLLICEGGEVGRTAIWHGAHDRIYFQKALHRVRLDPTVAVPEYVFQFMWFMAKNGGFRDLTTSATIAHLTGVKLKRLPCPRPPLEFQHRFAAIVESVEHQKASQRAHMAELDTLFASLQSRAFRGDL